MLSKQKREAANKQLKQIFSNYKAEYEALAEKSRNEYMRKLAPGELIPKSGRIYGAEAKQKFKDICAEYRAQAQEVLSDLITESKREATAAPSTEAVNAITLFNMKKTISEADVSDMLEAYGENPLAYTAIKNIAVDHEIRAFSDHPIVEQTEHLSNLSNSMNRHLTLESAENGHTSAGFLSAVGMDIDNALPLD